MRNVTDSLKRKKLADLYDYLNRNQAYLINYQEREQQGHTYTSQVAESHIESLHVLIEQDTLGRSKLERNQMRAYSVDLRQKLMRIISVRGHSDNWLNGSESFEVY